MIARKPRGAKELREIAMADTPINITVVIAPAINLLLLLFEFVILIWFKINFRFLNLL